MTVTCYMLFFLNFHPVLCFPQSSTFHVATEAVRFIQVLYFNVSFFSGGKKFNDGKKHSNRELTWLYFKPIMNIKRIFTLCFNVG